MGRRCAAFLGLGSATKCERSVKRSPRSLSGSALFQRPESPAPSENA